MVRLNAMNLGVNALIVFLSALTKKQHHLSLPYVSYFTLMSTVPMVTDLS